MIESMIVIVPDAAPITSKSSAPDMVKGNIGIGRASGTRIGEMAKEYEG